MASGSAHDVYLQKVVGLPLVFVLVLAIDVVVVVEVVVAVEAAVKVAYVAVAVAVLVLFGLASVVHSLLICWLLDVRMVVDDSVWALVGGIL